MRWNGSGWNGWVYSNRRGNSICARDGSILFFVRKFCSKIYLLQKEEFEMVPYTVGVTKTVDVDSIYVLQKSKARGVVCS